MKLKRHYNAVTFQTIMHHVSPHQKIVIQQTSNGYLVSELYNGTYDDLANKKENRKLINNLEYMAVSNIQASNDILYIGI